MVHRIRYFLKNWKIGVRLLFRTKRFGVNNKLWSNFDSIFGWFHKRKLKAILTIRPIINNYRRMEFRARACHFLSDDSYKLCFGKSKND